MRRGRLERIFDILRVVKQHKILAKSRLLEYAGCGQSDSTFTFLLEKGLISIKARGKHKRITDCQITGKGISALICFEELFKRL